MKYRTRYSLQAGVFIYSILWDNDSIIFKDEIFTGFADYHFAALEDSFLYTWTPGDLVCINVADPESIFIYRTYSPIGGNSGLVVRDGYAFLGAAYTFDDDSTFRAWPRTQMTQIDMINSATPIYEGTTTDENRFFGDLATDGEYIYAVNSEMSDGPAWTIGESNLRVWGAGGVSYNFDSRWDSQGVFGVDVIDDDLLAAGFEYGFSILNISDLDSIYEAAYYMDDTGNIDFTHFAMKDNRLYAMGHWSDSLDSHWSRLYMFKLDDNVVYSIDESTAPVKPAGIAISAWPNPFNSAVTITLDAPVGAIHELPLQIEIFNLNGRCVAQLPGSYVIPDPDRESRGATKNMDSRFHGNDRTVIWSPDETLGSGVYLVRARFDNRSLSGAEATTTKRIVYLK